MKVIYFNKETGKEVKYGEYITYKETKHFSNGHQMNIETTVPVINETLPDLLKKEIVVQKRVMDDSEPSLEEKLDLLYKCVTQLITAVDELTSMMLGEEHENRK